jgi:hypothetical protein
MEVTAAQLEEKNWGNTPLVLACKTGNTAIALALLQKSVGNAHLNLGDDHGMTALHWACFFRDEVLIEALIAAGADPSCKNEKNQTALELYQWEIPAGMRISFSGSTKNIGMCNLPKIPIIAEGRNRFLPAVGGDIEMATDCIIDILFHMDKIALHQLKISPSRLIVERQAAGYKSHQPNSGFEIFIYYHFDDFVRFRNAKSCSPLLVEQLTNQIALQPENELAQLVAELRERAADLMVNETISVTVAAPSESFGTFFPPSANSEPPQPSDDVNSDRVDTEIKMPGGH